MHIKEPLLLIGNNSRCSGGSRFTLLRVIAKTSDSENGIVPKSPRPIIAETDCDLVHCPSAGNKHWMTDVGNKFVHFPFDDLAPLGIVS